MYNVNGVWKGSGMLKQQKYSILLAILGVFSKLQKL